jgi:ethanolamine utilization cobalamin adenosyltransferase
MYDSAIFYSTELIGYEKSNFWKLLSQKPQDKLEAMHELQKIKSRQGVRWNIGLLRDNSKEVRALAAELILKNEYSAAIKDIENALNIETDSLTKITLQKTFNYLKTF